MRLSTLRYFIAVAEYSSFTRASERLFVSQPTLSRQVQDLEASLGVQLFVRQRQSLTLTAAGMRVLQEAKEIVRRCDGLKAVVRQGADAAAGVLNISYQVFLDTSVMYRTMTSVTRAHSGVDFKLFRSTPPEIRQSLQFGTCDLAFTLHTCVKSLPHVESVRIAENRLRVAVPRDHRLAERDVIDLRELAHEHFIMLEHRVSPLTVDYVTGLCMNRGITPQSADYVDNAETALFLVGIGKGITFVHSQMKIDLLDDSDAVKVLDIEGLDDELDYVVASTTNNANPLVPLFVAELGDLAD